MWQSGRRPYPQNQRKLNTRRTDEDVDGEVGRQLPFHLCPRTYQCRGTEECGLPACKELHVQKYPYNDFLYQTYDEEEV